MIDTIFHWCVEFLKYWAVQFGMTYEEINVYLFVFFIPAVIFIQFIFIAVLWLRKFK